MKNRIIDKVFIFSIFLLGLLFAQENLSELRGNLKVKLDQIKNTVNFPGATCAIVLPNDKIIQLSTGYADQENKIKMKTNDRMFLGSTGKTFVAAVLMQLVEENKIGLSDKVSKYLGNEKWFSRIPNSDDITVFMLCHHTSGLPRYVFTGTFGEDLVKNPDKVWKPEELLSYIFDHKPRHKAGTRWAYSDTNYIILGMIIEKICKNTFYNEVKKRFLLPLELTNISPQISRNPKGLVQGYSGEASFMKIPPKVIINNKYFINPQFEWCGGGFITTAADLAKWTKKLYSGEILSEESMDELLLPVSYRDGKISDQGYGIAVQISETKLGKKLGHTGLMPGYVTEIGYYEDYDLTIVIQINQDNFRGNKKNLGEYSSKLAEIVIDYLD